jgi:ubiquinol-cytochrome c reductase cytochrome b subunit
VGLADPLHAFDGCFGDSLVEFIRGDYSISDITLNRFFALHVIVLPLTLIGLIFVHIVALHEVGSNNPDGIEIKEHKGPDGIPLDGVPFHPHHTSKDLVGIIVFLMIFSGVVFFAPDMGGYFLEHANFEPANLTATPEHIAPVWYYTPYYAILRAVPSKLWGFILFGIAVVLPLFLPWLDRARVKSIRYRGWMYKSALTVFVITFLTLGWLGTQPAEGVYVMSARIFSVLYFMFFLLMPYYTSIDKTKPVPDRVVFHG